MSNERNTTAPSEGVHRKDINGIKNASQEEVGARQSPTGYKTILGTFSTKPIWSSVVVFILSHVIFVWSIFAFPYREKRWLLLYALVHHCVHTFGVLGGAHRLWSHRAFKANLALRIVLLLCYSSSPIFPAFKWAQFHRVHHKYVDTDADPHNSRRGFFFSHIGWMMMERHPEFQRRLKEVDVSDLLKDSVLLFEMKYYYPFKAVVSFIIPTIIPVLLWGEDWFWSLMMATVLRFYVTAHSVWLINSAAHMWGSKPYDRNIYSVENLLVSIVTNGEGWHNYHHTFPWDYKASELGNFSINLTASWIYAFSKIGWAFDLKTPSADFVKRVAEKRGDGSHFIWKQLEITPDFEDKICNVCNSGTTKAL